MSQGLPVLRCQWCDITVHRMTVVKQHSPVQSSPEASQSSKKDELIRWCFDEIRLVRRNCYSRTRGPRAPGVRSTDDEPGRTIQKIRGPSRIIPTSRSPVHIRTASAAQLSCLHHGMFLVCRLLFMHRDSIGGVACRTVVAVVAIKFGRIGTYRPSKSCQAVQRYCSSAVIMIGTLQVVLEGMHQQLLFLSDARSPAPAFLAWQPPPSIVRHSH